MLKFSVYTGAWILTILMFVASVTKTEKYNIIGNVDHPMCYYPNYCYDQYCKSLKHFDRFLLNFTHILGDFISVFLSRTCVCDSLSHNNRLETSNSKNAINDSKRLQKLLKNKLQNSPTYFEEKLIESTWIDTLNHFVNDTPACNNILQRSIKGTQNIEKSQIEYKWRRRTLCSVVDNERYSSKSLSEGNVFSVANKAEPRVKKTLLDYDGPVFINDIDDSDSLKAHVRVKRSKSEPDSSIHQYDYLKDLANSFPRNSYDSIDESSYDDDASFDRKREVKSQEFFANDEQLNDFPDEGEPSKIHSGYSFTVPAYEINDKPSESSIISVPSGNIKGNTFIQNNLESKDQQDKQHIMPLQESKKCDPFINQQPCEIVEEQNLPEDPMLAVEFVRRKGDDDAKLQKKRGVTENSASSDFENMMDHSKKSSEEGKRSVSEAGKPRQHLALSRRTAANLKAELLRIRRKAKENRHGKDYKLKKSKKHTEKKQNELRNSQRSVKNIRQKKMERSGVAGGRKKNEATKGDKSNVGIASAVPGRSNGNNLRRCSEKTKKSIDKIEPENKRLSKNVATTRHEKVKRDNENKLNTDHSKLSRQLTTGTDEPNLESDENTNAHITQDEWHEPSMENEQSLESLDDIISRSKRAKDLNHGFLNKADELRYYENIREPGSEIDQCTNQNEDQLSVSNEMEGNRAVRSIEEVKELAKELVTKVNELQKYLNVEEATNIEKGDKKIETRAIDDLCSNVSTACDAFKETPKMVQKCVPSTNRGDSTKKIVERKVDPITITKSNKLFKGTNQNLVEKKRSVGREVTKVSPRTVMRTRKQNESKSNHKWGKWTDWSSCSVTCGKGRQIRWRYCLRDCSTAETEMEEKACQLPACPPGKFLGIF